ncbi:dynamin family protein [Anoxybacillus rupiensis]|uniref:Dynamin family protein n=1 Tax=Anoxybacteroides rupiense TaxID=311460 RepID=A0ABT5W3K2_9BACL|nr:dynamin family protein [Anoxybacillus rupiensis]MBS2771771.1 dynamin family protein [Anoxybacillus rupiensis]MDE8563864.1 dynamin family protein [Anoxybacillus rupiensis]
MVQITQRSSLRPWLAKLAYLHDEWVNKGDQENAKKAQQLLRKIADEEFSIAFCGHFSAGKSSIINELIGEPLLPSSPIPTSANLVKVKAGREYARIFYKNGQSVEYAAPYEYEQIRAYCKNGEEIEAIEISRKTTHIPEGVAILDTPGIDSTDDAHRLATESALHLADVVFYMMDYNHVQSELNFQFTKELTSDGKALYLIVNQIDKHRDGELSFSEFQQSVREAFRQWNVQVERIFFTSLKEREHPFNELNELVHFFQLLFAEKEARLLSGVEVAAKRLVSDHLAFIENQDAKEEEAIYARMEHLTKSKEESDIDDLESRLHEIDALCAEVETKFQQELDSILEHAYVMPFETRELAKAYLQSVQPDFKIGFLFSKAKTEQERKARLTAFYENVKEKATSQIEWHVRDHLVRFLKEHDIGDAQLMSQCQQLSATWNEQLLESLVKKGAGVTGESVLNYTNDVATELKKRYRSEAMHIFAPVFSFWKNTVQAERNELAEQLKIEKEKQQLLDELAKRKQQRDDHYAQLLALLESAAPSHIQEARVQELVSELTPIQVEQAVPSVGKEQHSNAARQAEKSEAIHSESVSLSSDKTKEKTAKAIADLRQAAELVSGIPGMTRFIHGLTEKARRLENRTFTVALFGAFSAGKSSFANALMGEQLLPSSPNPTTATINKIVPPTSSYPHGTVVVQMKTASQLLKDLQNSLRYFHLKAETMEEALGACEKALLIETVEAKEKPHYTFLQSVVHGYADVKDVLGTSLQIGLDEFQQYVADETKACFVEWMELYYDCALTRQGIALVDTPGADSINARHTGVAFEYIKNADAVLFVTYYNHAFSKADREFLIQLGRVKDTFSMDKMFFIVNAADLANSQEELETVTSYVKEQLEHFGIRFPRLYALSSRLALEEKTEKKQQHHYGILRESGIRAFEEDFIRFIMGELTNVAVAEAYAELKRLRATLQDYMVQAKQGNEEKAAKRQKLGDEQARIQALLQSSDLAMDRQALKQEIAELAYYIKQRISFRMGDWFKEAFNPAALRDDGRDIRQALSGCLRELLQSVGFDLAQEMRATSLRIERFLTNKAQDRFQLLANEIGRIHQGITLSKVELPAFATLEFSEGLEQLNESHFKKALSLYKNAKAFFERDEKRLMREEIEKQLQQPIHEYVSENEARLFAFYQEEHEKRIHHLLYALQQQMDDYFAGLMTALTEQVDVEHLGKVEEQLSALLPQNE